MVTFIQEGTAGTYPIGVFTDGSGVPLGSLNIIMEDIKLSKNGAAFATTNAQATAYANLDGWYTLLLDATDTNTRGELVVQIVPSGNAGLPVWKTFQVVPTLKHAFLLGDGVVPSVSHVGVVGSTAYTALVGSAGHVASLSNPVVLSVGSVGYVSEVGSVGHVASLANPVVLSVGSVGFVTAVGSVGHVASMSNPIVGGGSIGHVASLVAPVILSVGSVGFVTEVGSVGHVASGAISVATVYIGTVGHVLSVGSVAYVSEVGSLGHVSTGYTQTVGTVTRVLSVGSIDTTAITGGIIGTVTHAVNVASLGAAEVKIATIHDTTQAILGDTNELQTDDTPTALAGLDGKLDAIQAKTDNLPTDPADDSDIDAGIAGLDTKIDNILGGSISYVAEIGSAGHVSSLANPVVLSVGSVGFVTSVGSVGHVASTNLLGDIKSKTDNLPTDPADDSDIDAGIAGLDTKIDQIIGGSIAYVGEVGSVGNVANVGDKADYNLAADQSGVTVGIVGTVTYAQEVGSVGHVATLVAPVILSVGSVAFVSAVGSVGYVSSLANPVVPFVGSVGWVGSIPAPDILSVGSVGYVSIVGSVGHVATGYTFTITPKKGVALTKFTFRMIDSSDGITSKTGATVTAEVSKDGGAYAAMTDTVTEISDGAYEVDISATEMNANVVSLKFTASGCIDNFVTIVTSA